MIHGQHLQRESFQRNGQQFNQESHGVRSQLLLSVRLDQIGGRLQDLVHVAHVVCLVSLDRELQESDFQLEQARELDGPSLLFDYLICVFLEKFEQIQVFVEGLEVVFFLRSELRKPFHERNENHFDLDFGIQFRSRLQQRLEGSEVEFIRESLDNAFHQILLAHRVFALYDRLQQLR